MSVRITSALLVALAALGCASPHCGPEPEPIDAAEPIDAGTDASCAAGAGTIDLVEVPRTAETPTGRCVPGTTGLQALLFDARGHALGSVAVECVSGAVYRVAARPAGRYLRWGTQTVAGGTLLGDTACPDPGLAFCDPIDVVVTSCGPTVVPYTLPCPAGVTDCGGGA